MVSARVVPQAADGLFNFFAEVNNVVQVVQFQRLQPLVDLAQLQDGGEWARAEWLPNMESRVRTDFVNPKSMFCASSHCSCPKAMARPRRLTLLSSFSGKIALLVNRPRLCTTLKFWFTTCLNCSQLNFCTVEFGGKNTSVTSFKCFVLRLYLVSVDSMDFKNCARSSLDTLPLPSLSSILNATTSRLVRVILILIWSTYFAVVLRHYHASECSNWW